MESRIARLEGAYEQIADRLNAVERSLEALRAEMNARFSQVDQKFMWMIGLQFTTWITVMLAIAPLYFRK
jgi:hypothetical protein